MVTRQSFNRRTAEPQSAFITVREAARQLGIGEGLAYRMANQYLASRWASGLPCVRFGRRLLVSRTEMARLVRINVSAASSDQRLSPIGTAEGRTQARLEGSGPMRRRIGASSQRQCDDPEKVATRWSEIIEIERSDVGGVPNDPARQHDAALRPDCRRCPEGRAGIDLACSEPDIVRKNAARRKLPAADDYVVLVGMQCYLR